MGGNPPLPPLRVYADKQEPEQQRGTSRSHLGRHRTTVANNALIAERHLSSPNFLHRSGCEVEVDSVVLCGMEEERREDGGGEAEGEDQEQTKQQGTNTR